MKRLILLAMAMFLATASQAAITWFTDRTVWTTAIGAVTYNETFSGFTVDTDFKPVAVAINGGSLSVEGIDTTNFRNIIDVPAFAFTDNNGTNHVSGYVNAAETNSPGRQIRNTLAFAHDAYGFETWGAASGERVTVEAYNGATLLSSFNITNNGSGIFTGFVASGGDFATSVRYRSTNVTAGSGGEGFGMDNLAGRAVPEPASMAVLGLGVAALLRRRRR